MDTKGSLMIFALHNRGQCPVLMLSNTVAYRFRYSLQPQPLDTSRWSTDQCQGFWLAPRSHHCKIEVAQFLTVCCIYPSLPIDGWYFPMLPYNCLHLHLKKNTTQSQFPEKNALALRLAPSVDHRFSVSFQKTQVQVCRGPAAAVDFKVISTGSSKSRISDQGFLVPGRWSSTRDLSSKYESVAYLVVKNHEKKPEFDL